jgi:hypothetical protein
MNQALIVNWHYQPKASVFSYFDIGQKEYYSSEANQLAQNAYLVETIEPTLALLEANAQCKINLSITTLVLRYLEAKPNLIDRLKKLLKAGQIEMLGGQGSDSLSLLYSRKLFSRELAEQLSLMDKLFKLRPAGYISPGMLYSAELGEFIISHQFKYAVVPRVSWYTKEHSGAIFSNTSGKLKLFVPGSGAAGEGNDSPEIVLSGKLSEDLPASSVKFMLLSTLTSKKKLPVYNLQQLAAHDLTGKGIDSLVSNNLQKDFLKKLSALAPAVDAADEGRLTTDFLWLGSVQHFRELSNSSNDSHKSYARLQTFLYDLEIRLR